MRVDAATPKTWLLAATAAWALAAWLLALAGMGGRVAARDDDPALLPALPPLPKVSANRLGALTQYGETAARPLFATDRRPHPFFIQPNGGETQTQAFDLVLTSVLITPNLRMAMLQNPDGSQSVRVKLGEAPEAHPGWRLVALNTRSAVFAGPEGEKTMDLRVFDGRGGQAPTALRNAPPPRAPVASARPPVEPPIQPPAEPQRNDAERAAAPAAAATPATPPSETQPTTEQAQMEAIRKRIEARRAQLRQQAAQNPPQQPPTPPSR